MIKKYLGITLITASMLAMGCSSDDDDDPVDTTDNMMPGNGNGGPMPPAGPMAIELPTAAYDPSMLDPVPDPLPMENVVDVIAADTNLSMLSTLISGNADAAALLATMPAAGFTVFAPADPAFTTELQTAVAGMDAAQVLALLQGHVVAAALPASAVLAADGMAIPVAAGDPVAVVVFGEADAQVIRLNDAANVTGTAFATNGIVHTIDGILLPAAMEPEPMEPDPMMPPAGGTLASAIAGDEFSEFRTAFEPTPGLMALDDPMNTWTVFVPNNTVAAGATIDALRHIHTDAALDEAALGALTSLTMTGGAATYDVVLNADGSITVGGNTVSVLSQGATSIIYSIDGVLP